MNRPLSQLKGPGLLERTKALLGSRGAVVVLLALIFAAIWLLAYVQEIPSQRLLSLAVRGVMLGGILALGAIGLSLVFGVMKFGNFAHGDLMTLGAYLALPIVLALPSGAALAPFTFGWEFLLALVIAMPLVGLAAYLIDRVIYRPLRLRRSSPVILAMAALGMAFFVRSLIYLIWGADFHFYYLGRARPALVELFSGVRVRHDQLFILGLAVVLVVLVYLLLEKTKMGKAMRATADNPDLARVSGINTDRVVLWTWLIGGALAGAGGIMFGLDAQLRPEMGWFLLLPLFAAVILGSIGNPYGALVGALIIGVAQQMSTAFINPAYAPGVAFVILILVLLFRPQGIFGKPGG
jgi:branched-chain amino acid transport system permease protein/neutral amino acid transport system permease protein